MLIENNNADLRLLRDYFVDSEYYTKDEILSDLQAAQAGGDFLCVLMDDGFLIGHRNARNALWVAQLVNHGPWKQTRQATEHAKRWAAARGMIGIVGETDRRQERAIRRLGWERISLIVGQRL